MTSKFRCHSGYPSWCRTFHLFFLELTELQGTYDGCTHSSDKIVLLSFNFYICRSGHSHVYETCPISFNDMGASN